MPDSFVYYTKYFCIKEFRLSDSLSPVWTRLNTITDYRLLSIFGLIPTIPILTRWFSLTLSYWDFFRHWLLAMSDCSTCHLLQKPHLGEWWCYFDESCASLWECNPSSMPSVMKSSLNTSIISKKSLPQKFFLTLPKRSYKPRKWWGLKKSLPQFFSLSLPKWRYEVRKRLVSKKSLPQKFFLKPAQTKMWTKETVDFKEELVTEIFPLTCSNEDMNWRNWISKNSLPREIFPSENAVSRYSTSLVTGDTDVKAQCFQSRDHFSCRLCDLSFLICYTWTISVIR